MKNLIIVLSVFFAFSTVASAQECYKKRKSKKQFTFALCILTRQIQVQVNAQNVEWNC